MVGINTNPSKLKIIGRIPPGNHMSTPTIGACVVFDWSSSALEAVERQCDIVTCDTTSSTCERRGPYTLTISASLAPPQELKYHPFPLARNLTRLQIY